MTQLILVAAVVWLGSLSGAEAASFSSGGSSTTKRMMEDLDETAKAGEKESLDRLFDQQANQTALAVDLSQQSGNNRPQPEPKPGKVAAPATPAVPQGDLGNLKVSNNGDLFRTQRAGLFTSQQNIQKAVPNAQGHMYNNKGEFIGQWQTVSKAETDQFQPINKDGSDHLYTFQNKNGSKEVYRDGKFVTALTGSELAEFKAGPNDKLYTRLAQGSQDVIMSVDPATGKQAVVATVPAEIRVWDEYHKPYTETRYHTESRVAYRTAYETDYEYETRYDSNGDAYEVETMVQTPYMEQYTEYYDVPYSVYHEGYTETHRDRYGVKKFEVTGQGQVLVMHRQNIIDAASGKAMGSQGEGPVFNEIPWGNAEDFSVDAHGNLYATTDGSIHVNGSPMGVIQAGNQNRGFDSNGNVIQTAPAGGWNIGRDIIVKKNILSDPVNGEKLASN